MKTAKSPLLPCRQIFSRALCALAAACLLGVDARSAAVPVPGDLNTNFNPGTGADWRVLGIARQPDGKLVVGGQFNNFNGVPRNRVTRLNYDGSTDFSFNPGSGADSSVNTVAVAPDGKVVVGGDFLSFNGVTCQRLVRLNCKECAAPHTPTPQEQSWLESMLSAGETASPKRGMGCSACNGTGYSGRQGVYELLEMDADMTQASSRADPATFMRIARERMKGQTMAFHALELVRQGRTSLAEALRVGFDLDESGEEE
jgi:hypothetical protein